MAQALVIHVRLHEGRYHGEGNWPPSPARLFQALVAGAGLAGPLSQSIKDALCWLEQLPPPVLGAPSPKRGQKVNFYMPNNDDELAHGKGATKTQHPWLFNKEVPFIYVWKTLPEESGSHLETVRSLVEGLYQLGRGLDMAWGWMETLEGDKVDEYLQSYPGLLRRPTSGGSGEAFSCPQAGSLESLERRYQAYGARFKEGVFTQAPRPSFKQVAYDSAPARRVYVLTAIDTAAPYTWPLEEVNSLVILLRDRAVGKLKGALRGRTEEIERVMVGRRPDGSNGGPTEERVRIIPLPSIGHIHADRGIRRVLVEVPAECPVRAGDIHWAFSGLEPADATTGEVYPFALIASDDESMLNHYGFGEGKEGSIWRSVTPVALFVSRRRIEPSRKVVEAKTGPERLQEIQQAAGAVFQALRHMGVRTRPSGIRVQREPFEANGKRVEAFSPGTRFPKECLWHVEISFSENVSGPLILGNGRFLGLGIMAPVRSL